MKIKKLTSTAIIPTKGSQDAAGWDLYADIESAVGIQPHETKMIGTGVAMALPKFTFGALYARSGLASKQGLRPANCVGVVDNDYRGEVKVPLHNDSNEVQIISPGDRIAQLVIQTYLETSMEEVDDLDATERGEGGFGSTGH